MKMYLAEIKKEQIKIGKDNVEVSLGSLRGNFQMKAILH